MRCMSSVSLRKRDQHRVAIKAVAILDVQTFDNPVLRGPNLGLQLHALDHHQDGAGGHGIARNDLQSDDSSWHWGTRDVVTIVTIYGGKSAQRIDIAERTRPAAHVDMDHVAVDRECDRLACTGNGQAATTGRLLRKGNRAAPTI